MGDSGASGSVVGRSGGGGDGSSAGGSGLEVAGEQGADPLPRMSMLSRELDTTLEACAQRGCTVSTLNALHG